MTTPTTTDQNTITTTLTHLARTVAHRREELGLTQHAVAYGMHPHGYNWSGPTVGSIERQLREPRVGEALALAQVLNLTLEELLGLEPPEGTPDTPPLPDRDGADFWELVEGPATSPEIYTPMVDDTATARELRALKREILQLRAELTPQ